jgi:hypothetical protein
MPATGFYELRDQALAAARLFGGLGLFPCPKKAYAAVAILGKLDFGMWQKAGFLAKVRRDGNLAFAGDAHGQFPFLTSQGSTFCAN